MAAMARSRPRPRLASAIASALVAGCTSAKPPEQKTEPAPEAPAPAAEAPPAPPAAPPAPPEPPKPRRQPRPATLAASSQFACAIEGAGAVACWGAGPDGQLAPGVDGYQPAPVRVPGLADAVALAVSNRATCALRAEGSLMCWGDIGVPATHSLTSKALGDVVELAMNEHRASVCARRRDGTVACATLAELHRGETHAIAGLTDAVGLALYNDRLYVLRDGGALEWYEIDRATQAPKPAGTREAALGEVVDLARLDSSLCAALAGGEVRCRSYAPEWKSEVPTAGPLWKAKLPGELWASTVDEAGNWSLRCVRDVAGTVSCWGDNRFGQLGIGKPAFSVTPVPLLAGPTTTVDAGGDLTCGVVGEGKLACHMQDALALDDEEARPEGVTALAIGGSHSCAIVGGGEARCWGFNESGALGAPGITDGLARVVGLSDLTAIAVGEDHSCAARRDHTVRCWGSGEAGQLGDGQFLAEDADEEETPALHSFEPKLVDGIAGDVLGLALGDTFSCAATTVGVHCWGLMPHPEELDGIKLAAPRVVLAGPVRSISAEDGSICAVTTEGAVHCGGAVAENYRGGRDIARARDEQRRRAPLAEMKKMEMKPAAVAVGSDHACLLSETGEVACWGANSEGQLGDGTTKERAAPVAVKGLPGPALQITAGDFHSCARVADGSIWCWGSRTAAREFARSTKPQPVKGLAPHVIAAAAPPVPPAPPGANPPVKQ